MRIGHVGLLAFTALCGCSTSDLDPEPQNRSPDTRITSGPPDSSAATSYQVPLAWLGSDPDGSIQHYEFIVVDHPAAWDSISDIVVRVPAPDDHRWRRIAAVESTFVVSADTLRIDPRTLPPEEARRRFFERWHSFFVRAVDDRGAPDPSPDYRTFNARTLAPTVALGAPVTPFAPFTGRPNVTFRWSGDDPLDKVSSTTPDSSRWALVRTHRNDDGSFAGLPDTLYNLPPASWSAWRAWGAAAGGGTEAELRNLVPVGNDPNQGYYLFAVQAKDAAGAATPVFDWQTPGKNNAVPMVVTGQVGPTLVIDGPLGTYIASGPTLPIALELASRQRIQFRWNGDASAYGGMVDAYRWGWNITNPEDLEQWQQPWAESVVSTPVFVLQTGLQKFFLQARDDLGGITSIEFHLDVIALTRERELLFVDDTAFPSGLPEESIEDRRWHDVLDSLRARRPFPFDPARDIYDVEANRFAPPPLGLLFDYRTVVWSVRSSTLASALRQLGWFCDPFAEECRSNDRPSHLLAYLDGGGRMWVSGDRPAQEVWPDELQPDLERRFPVSVTHWDNALEPHPGVDSVGTLSFLYRMGIEAFDVGAGSIAPRPRRDALHHACQGFRRAGAPSAGEPAELLPDPAVWPLPPISANPRGGRFDVEIYNMPGFLSTHVPPLDPSRRSRVAYLYTSDVSEDPIAGIVWPVTADGQPAIILTKLSEFDAEFSRAWCGFEPWRLQLASQVALAEFILLEHLRVGLPDAP